MTPLILEFLLIGVAIGLVVWKRIKVAEFLYNLQLPKLTELPQLLRQKWRPSSPPPELAALLVYSLVTDVCVPSPPGFMLSVQFTIQHMT